MMLWMNGGNAARLIGFALGFVGNHAGVEIDRYRVACINAVRRCLTLEDRQADIDGVAVENSARRWTR